VVGESLRVLLVCLGVLLVGCSLCGRWLWSLVLVWGIMFGIMCWFGWLCLVCLGCVVFLSLVLMFCLVVVCISSRCGNGVFILFVVSMCGLWLVRLWWYRWVVRVPWLCM